MPVYMIYRAKDGTEVSMFEAAGERTAQQEYLLTHAVTDEPMELVATFWARGWRQAKRDELAILGFDG